MWFQVNDKYERLGEYVVQIFGYGDTKLTEEQISIYEYMPGGTLQQHLHGEFFFHIVQSKSKWICCCFPSEHMLQLNFIVS